MQNNIQAFNEGRLQNNLIARENFDAFFEKRVDDLKMFFQEKKLTHHTTAENKKSRSGYIEISKILKNYGFFPKEYLEDFSSGEESDIDDEKMNEPSVKEVSEKMVDFRTIVNVKKIAHIPKNARPGIIITNLDEWVTIPILKRFIEDIPIFSEERINPDISDIRISNYKGVIFAFILLLNIDHTKKIFSFFNHPQKIKNNPTKNSKAEKMEFFYAFDLLDMKNSEWYGVVLRNIPEKCSHENLKNHLTNYSKNINSLLPAMKIKSSYCTLVVLNSIEDAEKICIHLNKKEKGKNRYIKAHLHPRTCHMRKYPENSIFNNYFRLENGNYFKKYYPNNLGYILSSNFSNIKSKYTPINIILSDLNSLNLIAAQQQSNNPFNIPNNNNQENKKNSIDELNKNQSIKEKEITTNKTRQNNLNGKDSVNEIGINNLFKKTSTDFLNFDFDREENNKKKPTFDMNTSYLTKLIMKPSVSNTNKVEENNMNSLSNPNDNKAVSNDLNLNQNENSCSSINAFINDLDANKKLNLKSAKDNVIKENSNKNLIGSLKKLEIGANKNDSANIQLANKKGLIPKIKQNSISNSIKDSESCKFDAENKNINQQQLSNNTNTNKILLLNEEDFKLNKSNNNFILNKQPSEIQYDESTNIIGNKEEKLNKSTTMKKGAKHKESTKKVEISNAIANNCSSQTTPNQQQLPTLEYNKLSGSNTNNNNTTVNNNLVKNESIISNLSGILKEMVKSDKEKTMKIQINEIEEKSTPTINKNTANHNDNSINLDNKKNLDGNNLNYENKKMIIDSGNMKINDVESEEEIIEFNYNTHNSEFFKYDFQEKSYYEKPKNYRMQYKSNKDDKYSNPKSIYDRSRDREKDKDRERDKNYSYQKNNERTSKKYNSSLDDNFNGRNSNQESNYNNYNTVKVANLNAVVSNTNQSNPKINEITNIQNIYISNVNNNPNISSTVLANNQSLNQNNSNNIQTMNTNLNNSINSKSRFSKFSSGTIANNDQSSQKESKHSSTRILELSTSTTVNNPCALETGNLPNVLSNLNVKKCPNQHQQNGNQQINTSNSNNNTNYIPNTSQQQGIPNNKSQSQSQSQYHSQPSANIIYQNNPNLSHNPQHNNYFSGKISSNNQIPFNPIIQNNSTIINNFINIIPPPPQADLTKEFKNQNTTGNLNNQQYSQNNSQTFNNIAFNGAAGNIPNVNLVFPKNTKIIKNNMNISSNIQGQQSNFVTITNLNHPQGSQQNISNNKKASSNNNNLILNADNNSNSKNSNINSLINPSSIIKKVESKNEIILPPLDDFVPPLPPENPPEPEVYKGDESDKFKDKSSLYEQVSNKNETGINTINNIHNNINIQSNVFINSHEKTEPGQILAFDSEEEFNANNTNLQGYRSKKIDVKNAPINFKKYNFSKSSSSSSNSYKKSKEYINRKREREKQRKYSKEREKDRKKKKHRSRSKERSFNTNNNSNDDKYSHANSNRKDNRDNKFRNERKYNESVKKYSKPEEHQSSSSSSSFQSGEDGRYYKRLLERRTNTKKEKR